MKIFNRTTKKIEELSYIVNSQDMASEMMLRSDQIKYNRDEDQYEANDEEIRWWEKWLEEQSLADDMEDDVKTLVRDEKFQNSEWISHRIEELKMEAGWCDFEDIPRETQKLLKELYKDIQEWSNKMGYKPVEGYWRLEPEPDSLT